ncbi:hypothetical protein R1T16_16650 [Flavobacterium sp. DG1-102-2]|uniref:hypothetical protein n=1 Tax=Flavobacterium sp. DG1-102-2 TaxID=3081663 RepID=UPI00294A0CF0|nr:hypothetical protein [Flavobacterium sp. DG1-102-2]MDV6170070.1 hypothetical protein [Flavobacterium sp. DG1-102-2]
MKKIFLLLSIVSVFGLTGCSNDDDVVVSGDGDTYPEVFDTAAINFTPDENGRYSALVPLDPAILSSDVVLVYRRVVDDGFTVWQPIPDTVYLPNGTEPDLEIDYKFNFTTTDVLLYMQSTFALSTVPQYTNGQVFRIVLVPGYIAQNLDNTNYDTVMSAVKEANGSVEIQTIK